MEGGLSGIADWNVAFGRKVDSSERLDCLNDVH